MKDEREISHFFQNLLAGVLFWMAFIITSEILATLLVTEFSRNPFVGVIREY